MAFGSITGILEFPVWDGIFYLQTDLVIPTIRFQRREVHELTKVVKPSWRRALVTRRKHLSTQFW